MTVIEEIIYYINKEIPELTIYTESEENPVFPNAYLSILNIKDSQDRINYKFHIMEYYIGLTVRIKDDPRTDLSLNENLYKMGRKLTEALNLCDSFNIREKNYSMKDDILEFRFSFKKHMKESEGLIPKQGKLVVDVK